MSTSSEHSSVTLQPPASSRAAGGDGHRLDRYARLQIGADGVRVFSAACSCGWLSEACGTEVLAEAYGEQHVTFARASAGRRRRGQGGEPPPNAGRFDAR